MKNVIIIGSNSVAINIAETLCNNPNINLYIIESSEKRFYEIKDTLDAEFILGNEIDPEVLLRADIKNCDVLLALSDKDSVNISVGLIANYFNKNIKIINHIDNSSEENYEILSRKILKINDFISPEKLTAEQINNLLKHNNISEYHRILKGKFVITAFEINKNNFLTGKKLADLKDYSDKYSVLVIGVIKDNKFILPNGKTTINEGDTVYILISEKNIKTVFDLLDLKKEKINTILIGGGGRYTEALLNQISNQNYKITVLERDNSRINYLKEKFPDISYILADIRNLDRIESKKLFNVDIYIAMTDNDNTNFITSVYAQSLGTKVISIYFNQNNFQLFNSYKIKNIINPKTLVTDELLSYFHIGKIISASSLRNEEIETVEFIPSDKSILINRKLKEINEIEILVGLINHNGHTSIARGDTVIKEGDKVLFFVKQSEINKVLKKIK